MNNTGTSASQQQQQRQPQDNPNNVETLYISDDINDLNHEEYHHGNSFTITKIVLSVIFVSVIVVVIIDFSTTQYIQNFFDSVLSWIEANPKPGFLLSIGIYFISTILFIPVSILALGSAFVFAKEFGLTLGVFLTTLAVYIGASTGAMVSFLLGRYLFRDYVHRMAARHTILQALDSAMKEKGFRIMSLLHLSPIIPFGALNYIAGITAVSFTTYFCSLFAILPGTIFYSFVGASAGSLADSGRNSEKYELIGIAIGLIFAIFGLMVMSYYTRLELDKAQQNCIDTTIPNTRHNNSKDSVLPEMC